jgi:hypothetical protein
MTLHEESLAPSSACAPTCTSASSFLSAYTYLFRSPLPWSRFHAPFGAKYSYAGGFFLYFVYTYMGMTALGLATEAMITILTPRFMTFFLIPLIISNVSVASLPFDLQPWFYKYGYGFPVL